MTDPHAEPYHMLTRDEWERQFAARMKERFGDTVDDVADIAAAELTSWPESDSDWRTWTPADAADENLSYWEDDGE